MLCQVAGSCADVLYTQGFLHRLVIEGAVLLLLSLGAE